MEMIECWTANSGDADIFICWRRRKKTARRLPDGLKKKTYILPLPLQESQVTVPRPLHLGQDFLPEERVTVST